MISLRNKIGQMLIMGFDGCDLNEHNPVSQWLTNDGLGGVILFNKDLPNNTYGKNLKSQEQIHRLIKQLNECNDKNPNLTEEIPLFISIDYEGGAVDRLSTVEGCMPTLTAQELANLSEKDLEEELKQMAISLKSLGFNLNFAPVVDLQLTNELGIIGSLGRSFSKNPDKVVEIAGRFVRVFSEYGIATCYKHFPGHGSAHGDTHEGFVDVTQTFKTEELVPYRALLRGDSPAMVMTAHVVNKQLDPSGLPATLSQEILTNLLRKSIGFDGVIISDDLQMKAIAQHYSLEESLRLTINAGADMLIFGNQLGEHTAPEIIDSIEQLVVHKKIDQKRIDDAYRRVMRLKQQILCLSPMVK